MSDNNLNYQNLFTHPVQPRNVALMVVGENISAMSRHMPLNTDPFLYGVTVNNKTKTLQLLENQRYFSLNFIGQDLLNDTDYCGRVSGHTDTKLENVDFKLAEYNAEINYIPASMGVMILEKENIISFGDHHLIVGRVIYMMGNGKKPAELDPILFWGRGYYSQIGETKRYRSPKLPPRE